ncbi:MAG: universal stress protein [Actinomycetota bacterium]|nr:universal stress protein [Actinomycetota bacterium]
MSVILVGLDTSAAARPVLDAAVAFGAMAGVPVEAVHVHDGAVETPATLAARSGVALRVLEGPTGAVLIDAFSAAEVCAAVVGARATPGGRRPVGRIARAVVEKALKPVLVVPPEASLTAPIRRILLPLEGMEISSRPVQEALWPLVTNDVELVALHVFTDATLPRMLDQPAYDLEVIGQEFLARHCPPATKIVLRPGPVGRRVFEVSAEHGIDVVVLSWSQDSSPGRAQVVQEVLGTLALPVLLLPVAARAGGNEERTVVEEQSQGPFGVGGANAATA